MYICTHRVASGNRSECKRYLNDTNTFCEKPPPCPACPACPTCPTCPACPACRRWLLAHARGSSSCDWWNAECWTASLKANVVNIFYILTAVTDILRNFPDLIWAMVTAAFAVSTVAVAALWIHLTRLPTRIYRALLAALACRPPSPPPLRCGADDTDMTYPLQQQQQQNVRLVRQREEEVPSAIPEPAEIAYGPASTELAAAAAPSARTDAQTMRNPNPDGKCAHVLPHQNRYCKRNPVAGSIYCSSHHDR